METIVKQTGNGKKQMMRHQIDAKTTNEHSYTNKDRQAHRYRCWTTHTHSTQRDRDEWAITIFTQGWIQQGIRDVGTPGRGAGR